MFHYLMVLLYSVSSSVFQVPQHINLPPKISRKMTCMSDAQTSGWCYHHTMASQDESYAQWQHQVSWFPRRCHCEPAAFLCTLVCVYTIKWTTNWKPVSASWSLAGQVKLVRLLRSLSRQSISPICLETSMSSADCPPHNLYWERDALKFETQNSCGAVSTN